MTEFRLEHPDAPRDPASDQWGTPPALFNELNRKYQFTADAAGNALNHVVAEWMRDGLDQSWAYHRVWCNPPYSNPLPWVQKAYTETKHGNCPLAVLLLPVDTSTRWFHEFVWNAAEVEFLRGRLTFVGAPGPARFASMIAVYR